jgi:hypothetical protein
LRGKICGVNPRNLTFTFAGDNHPEPAPFPAADARLFERLRGLLEFKL